MIKEKKAISNKLKNEVDLPSGVIADINGDILLIKGPKGDVKREIKQHNISVKIIDGKLMLESNKSTKKYKKIIGSLTAHIRNMVTGSLRHHFYTLKICSGHFPMNVSISDSKLIVKNFLGEKIPRVLQLKEGADIKIDGDLIYVASTDKEIAGQVSADIEQLTKRPRYDPRIFQDGIYIINKDGKELK